MSGFLSTPVFTPAIPPIQLGTASQVLTMVAGVPRFAAPAGGSSGIGAELAYSPAAGTLDATPAGFVAALGVGGTGRLLLTLAGDTIFQGLTAGVDGQVLVATIVAGAFQLLFSANNGATAVAQFFAAGAGAFVGLGNSLQMIYSGSLTKWVVTQ